jgi:ATP synthase A1 C subunit
MGLAAAGTAVANNARQVMPYAYLMAKIRAWEARILDESRIEALSESGSLNSLALGLRGTDYEPELQEVPENVEQLESALNRRLVAIYRELFTLTPKKGLPYMRKFAERLDLANLKLVIRAASGAVERDVAVSYLGEGMVFHKARLEAMARSEGIEDLIKQLSETEYYQELRRFLEPGEYDPLDLIRAVEQSYYTSVWKKTGELGRGNGKIARTILGREVDFVNLKLVLRLKRAGVEPDMIVKNLMLMETGLGLDTLRACAQSDTVEGIRSVISRTALRTTVVPLLSSAGEDVAQAEKLLDESLLNFTKTLSLFKPLTIATPLAYLYAKHAEVRNIRVLARGIADRVPGVEMKRILLRSARLE